MRPFKSILCERKEAFASVRALGYRPVVWDRPSQRQWNNECANYAYVVVDLDRRTASEQ